jgi:hypothetical protein
MAQQSGNDPKKRTAAQQGAVPGLFIPATSEDWYDLVKAAKLSKHMINTLPAAQFGSGSTASQRQYLILRAYSPLMPHDPVFRLRTRIKDFGITPQHIENATNILEKSNGWIGYIQAIKIKAQADDLRAEDEE